MAYFPGIPGVSCGEVRSTLGWLRHRYQSMAGLDLRESLIATTLLRQA
jgi:hypothetical protein